MSIKILDGIKLDFDDVLIVPKRSELTSRENVDLYRRFKFPHNTWKLTLVPIIAANMNTVGTLEMARALAEHGMSTALHKHHAEIELQSFLRKQSFMYNAAFYTMGINQHDFDKLRHCVNILGASCLDFICIDVANGYMNRFQKSVNDVREIVPNAVIMAGNIATPDIAQQLIIAGADIVKIGIGPGSVCETRKVAGVGYPQLSAIMECADAAHGLSAHVCSSAFQ